MKNLWQLAAIITVGCFFSVKSDAQNTYTSSVLRKDGFYNTYDISIMPCGEKINQHYTIYAPLIIISNKNAVYQNGADKGNTLSTLDFYSNLNDFSEVVGGYSIKNNTITAHLPLVLFVRGMRTKIFQAHFRGTIKNRDTIINWRMIPPYPDAPKKFNNDFKDLTAPKLLYFIESKELSGLDSLYQQRLKEQGK